MQGDCILSSVRPSCVEVSVACNTKVKLVDPGLGADSSVGDSALRDRLLLDASHTIFVSLGLPMLSQGICAL